MKELKFRAWDLEKKEYVYNVFLDRNGSPYVFDLNERYINPFKPLNNVKLEQFIGLKDVNEVGIFKGDIVRWGMHGGVRGKEFPHRYAVVELNPDIQFKTLYYLNPKTNEKIKAKDNDNIFHFGSFIYKESEKYLEIVGNINEIK